MYIYIHIMMCVYIDMHSGASTRSLASSRHIRIKSQVFCPPSLEAFGGFPAWGSSWKICWKAGSGGVLGMVPPFS